MIRKSVNVITMSRLTMYSRLSYSFLKNKYATTSKLNGAFALSYIKTKKRSTKINKSYIRTLLW